MAAGQVRGGGVIICHGGRLLISRRREQADQSAGHEFKAKRLLGSLSVELFIAPAVYSIIKFNLHLASRSANRPAGRHLFYYCRQHRRKTIVLMFA